MADKLVCIADFLSYQEGILLYNKLQEAEISALVKTCGPPSIPFGEGQFYQLLVPEEDFLNAQEITGIFKTELAVAKSVIKCPKCRSTAILEARSLPFWQRIYYIGTQVFKCETCGKKFSK